MCLAHGDFTVWRSRRCRDHDAVGGNTRVEVGYLLPFTAGNFIYIAAADLLPEITRETRTRAKLETSIAFVAGLGLLLAATQISS